MATQGKNQDTQTGRDGSADREAMTPEEESKSNAFFVWLEATACQLNLDAREQLERKELYVIVTRLRPHHSAETLLAAQEAVMQWVNSHPADPLNATLCGYVEARRKEARLWSDLNIRSAT